MLFLTGIVTAIVIIIKQVPCQGKTSEKELVFLILKKLLDNSEFDIQGVMGYECSKCRIKSNVWYTYYIHTEPVRPFNVQDFSEQIRP